MSIEELEKYLDEKFNLKEWSEATKKLYKGWLIKLYNFYPNKKLSKLSFRDIDDYVKQLISRKMYTSNSLKQLMAACHFFYNELLNRNYSFYRIRLPKVKRKEKDLLTQEETMILINSFTNPKHKAIVATLYSCYLETKQILNLKITDVKPLKKLIQVKSGNANQDRNSILSDYLLRIFKEYKEYLKGKNKKLELYLFEGEKVGSPYSSKSLQNIIKKNLKKCNIHKNITPTLLRKSAIKHMIELGVPLVTLLDELGYNVVNTIKEYNEFCYENYQIDFSPLDKIVVKPKMDDFDLLDIEELVFEIKDNELRDYLKEAVSCLRIGALRAGVIFIWTAGIRLIQQRILDDFTLEEINKEMNVIRKSRKISSIDDFAFIKDDNTIDLSSRLGIFDKNEKNELKNSCLGLRNKCGHPSKYSPLPNKVKAYIEDMITMVFEK